MAHKTNSNINTARQAEVLSFRDKEGLWAHPCPALKGLGLLLDPGLLGTHCRSYC